MGFMDRINWGSNPKRVSGKDLIRHIEEVMPQSRERSLQERAAADSELKYLKALALMREALERIEEPTNPSFPDETWV